MEMCYDGTLVMPSSYAVMSEDEMTYVEGGGTVTINRRTIKKALAAAFGMASSIGFLINKGAPQIAKLIVRGALKISKCLLSLSGLGGFAVQALAFTFAGVVAASATVIGIVYVTNSTMKIRY